MPCFVDVLGRLLFSEGRPKEHRSGEEGRWDERLGVGERERGNCSPDVMYKRRQKKKKKRKKQCGKMPK